MDIIKNLEIIRRQKGYSQEYIANQMGVDSAVISNLETGKRKLKWSDLEIFSNIFEMSVIDIITYPIILEKKDNNSTVLNESFVEYGISDKDKLIMALNDRIKYQEKLINAILKIENDSSK